MTHALRSPGSAALRALTTLLAGAGVALASGFVWFVAATSVQEPPPGAADGIVVPTGGAERVETALRLLADGHGPILLVSGVGGDAAFHSLARRARVDTALATRVTLGRAATTTHGNAAEAAEWARTHRVHSLIVVTSGYHMPRTIAEFSRAMPDVTLYPVAVQPLTPKDAPSWHLLLSEYAKWLVCEAGLSGYASRPAPERGAFRDGTREAERRMGG